MEIKNFTPHPINILDADGKEITTIQPEGVAIRLKSTTKPAGFTDTIRTGNSGRIRLTKTVFGQAVGLPEPEAGTLLIVSQLVKSALPDRADLVVPAEVVRDESGRIVGCKSLGI